MLTPALIIFSATVPSPSISIVKENFFLTNTAVTVFALSIVIWSGFLVDTRSPDHCFNSHPSSGIAVSSIIEPIV